MRIAHSRCYRTYKKISVGNGKEKALPPPPLMPFESEGFPVRREIIVRGKKASRRRACHCHLTRMRGTTYPSRSCGGSGDAAPVAFVASSIVECTNHGLPSFGGRCRITSLEPCSDIDVISCVSCPEVMSLRQGSILPHFNVSFSTNQNFRNLRLLSLRFRKPVL